MPTDRLGSQIMDTRDLIERAEELDAQEELEEEEREEREEIQEIEDAGIPDYPYGETLIREDYFTDYARELAEDIGAISANAEWPLSHINWEGAADALKQDYVTVEYQGSTYYARA